MLGGIGLALVIADEIDADRGADIRIGVEVGCKAPAFIYVSKVKLCASDAPALPVAKGFFDAGFNVGWFKISDDDEGRVLRAVIFVCLLYTSDAADE